MVGCANSFAHAELALERCAPKGYFWRVSSANQHSQCPFIVLGARLFCLQPDTQRYRKSGSPCSQTPFTCRLIYLVPARGDLASLAHKKVRTSRPLRSDFSSKEHGSLSKARDDSSRNFLFLLSFQIAARGGETSNSITIV